MNGENMTYQDIYNSEHYRDPTVFFALRNIERDERKKLRKLRDDHEFRRGDVYMADLGYGVIGYDGSHVQGGIRPVVVLQNNLGIIFSPTLVVVPITSKINKRPELNTHYLLRNIPGLPDDGLALGEQITTIDKRQCFKYLGRLSRSETDAVKEAAINAIGENVDIPDEIDAP